MSIKFSCELTDPHTESLLRFLEDILGDNDAHKLEVLSCARQWLEMDAPMAFTRGNAHMKSSLLLVDDEIAPHASPLAPQPSPHLSV